MKVEHETVAPRTMAVGAAPRQPAKTPGSWADASDVAGPAAELSSRLPQGEARFVSRAPGRLDIMGGSAAHTGSLALTTSLSDCAYAAVQPRDDGMLWLAPTQPSATNGDRPITIPIDRLRGADAACADDLSDAGLGSDAKCVIAALAGLLGAGVLPDAARGLSVATLSTLDDYGDVGRDACLIGAVAAATAAAFGGAFDQTLAVDMFRAIRSDRLSLAVAASDVVAGLMGIPSALLQIRNDPCAYAGATEVPEGVTLVGADCGVVHPHVDVKNEQTRAAAVMGLTLIDRIIRHDGLADLQWDGHLSRVSMNDYVERFRDRIPTKLTGADFIEKFGMPDESLCRIDPKSTYKVRSRTEHQIYEHARAVQFYECLSRAARTRDDRALMEAGELMYASHWSYGQRCGLGSIETDLLVNLIRRHGEDAGIYGAKITGRGCGGVVAVLMRDDERTRTALDGALEDYRLQTDRPSVLLTGSLAGALPAGVARL